MIAGFSCRDDCLYNEQREVGSPLRFGDALHPAIDGPVAQLGERLVRNEEASGSIPLRSTIVSTTCEYPLAWLRGFV